LGLNALRKRSKKRLAFLPLLLVVLLVVSAASLITFVIVADGSNCEAEVCATSLDPAPMADAQISEVRRRIGLLVGNNNDRLILIALAFLLTALTGVLIFRQVRVGAQHVLNAEYFKRIDKRIDALNYTMMHDDGQHVEGLEEADEVLVDVSRTSKTPTSKLPANGKTQTSAGSFRGEQTLALLKLVDDSAEQLLVAIDRIKTIIADQDRPSVNGRSPSEEVSRTGEGGSEKQNAQQALVAIGRELLRVSNHLIEIKASVKLNSDLSPNVTTSKESEYTSRADKRRRELLAEHRSREIERQRNEVAYLAKRARYSSLEFEQNEGEREAVLEAKSRANSLLDEYAAGMPTFVKGRGDGSRFPTFLAFLSEANSHQPAAAARLDIMLRLLASAMERNEKTFELIWSVHEIGRALYGIMRTLGFDESRCQEEASAWARTLNKYGEGAFTIFVPAVKSAFNGLEMTGGTPQSVIQEVRSWGVRNKLGDVERKAIVR
jgi:hypothetical protein